MKLKISILATILCSMAIAAFGQKEPPKTIAVPNKSPDVTKLELKTNASKTPTVAEILEKHVQAIGGRKAYEKIKSRSGKGTVELAPMNVKGTFEEIAAAPDKSLMKTTLAGIGEIVEGYDGKAAWSINPITGSRDKKGEELAQTAVIYNFYRSINLDKLYQKTEYKGIEKVGTNDAYVIVATRGDLPPETFYFDTKNGLMVRHDATLSTPEGKIATKVFFEDFRDVDGIKIPFKTRAMLPQVEITTNYTEIKHNVAVEDAKFAKPKE